MSRSLKLCITGLVSLSAIALLLTSFVYATRMDRSDLVFGVRTAISPGVDLPTNVGVLAGLVFWVALTLFAGALPVRMPRGTMVSVAMAPIVAAMALGGPVAAGWVALIGTTEIREIRGRIPWYGTAANHAGVVLPAVAGGLLADFVFGARSPKEEPFLWFASTLLGAAALFVLNLAVTSVVVGLRTNQSVRVVAAGDWRGISGNAMALAPLAWLMAQMYATAWWASLLFALPLYTTRVAYHRFVEMRDMFTQTIGALAEAVDKRDPFTSKHSHRVKQIASISGARCGSTPRSWRRSSGAACSMTSARSACRTTSC